MTDLIPLRWSALKQMMRSPAHYKHYIEHGMKSTAAMRLGTLVHTFALKQPPRHAVWTGGAKRTNEAKAAFAAFELDATSRGLDIVDEDDVELASKIAVAVMSHAIAGPLLDGVIERRITWQLSGRECAGTPDVVGDYVVDLKTTVDASPDRFPWQAARLGYFGQGAWYLDGIRAAKLGDPAGCKIIAVETKPPFVVQVYVQTPAALDMSRRQVRALFEQLRTCEQSRHFPGYSQCEMPLDVPGSDLELDFGDDVGEAAE